MVDIKTDRAAGLSDWMADHITAPVLWELVLPTRLFLRFIYYTI